MPLNEREMPNNFKQFQSCSFGRKKPTVSRSAASRMMPEESGVVPATALSKPVTALPNLRDRYDTCNRADPR